MKKMECKTWKNNNNSPSPRYDIIFFGETVSYKLPKLPFKTNPSHIKYITQNTVSKWSISSYKVLENLSVRVLTSNAFLDNFPTEFWNENKIVELRTKF